MGKKDSTKNLPINPSLSYTLNNLLSQVSLETCPGKKDSWEPLNTPGAPHFSLSKSAQERFLNHLNYLKSLVDYSGAFMVRSNNNFPHSSGLASSASSFAALTTCATMALSELTNTPLPTLEVQAQLSREASGSSCRSFFGPWVLWEEETVKAIDVPYAQLLHQVIIVSHAEKKVSSSEAHQRITTSALYATRAQRAEQNLKILLKALNTNDWARAYQICWQEFQDLHQLFASSKPSFSYITDQSRAALSKLEALWEREGDGPLITMDAGPNIHLLYRPDQADMALKFKCDYLIGHYDVL
jgi:diphosphomevalonate decarboxylase